MEEKSKQQQVFDWLLENPEHLYNADNTELYEQFEDSGLSRNRLRSYKSRLKEKIDSGEINLDDQEDETDEIGRTEFRFNTGNMGTLFKGAVFLVAGFVIYKLFKKFFS